MSSLHLWDRVCDLAQVSTVLGKNAGELTEVGNERSRVEMLSFEFLVVRSVQIFGKVLHALFQGLERITDALNHISGVGELLGVRVHVGHGTNLAGAP